MQHCTRIILIAGFILLAALPARGQDGLKFADLGDFHLENGRQIRDCKLGYRTFGQLNPKRTNAVLIPCWFLGRSKDLAGLIGPGKLVDSSKYFVIAVDDFANGVSSSPSNSKSQPGHEFPMFSIGDMVNAQHKLVTGDLKLAHLHAVLGISMGGMETFQWMTSYPGFMDKAIPIEGTPHQTSYDLLLWSTELHILEASGNCGDPKSRAMELAAIHAMAMQTPHYIATHTSPQEFPEFLSARAERLLTYNTTDWTRQMQAIMGQDIYKPFEESAEKAAKAVRARVLVVVAEEDHAVNPMPSLEFAGLLKAETVTLPGDCGHMAFTCERDRLYEAVAHFLDN